ncbi:PKD domain containing protein [Desulfurispirillum indicum S5]|uniref:PKD domain containing protein n=1 Tax=Desulfurispirillum indicum (strain ATCC BAA-1389 / DSM 22839 / S5) TaxID=653733 RepID=E6W451_DESIS|nr:PKD domain-containing protein [Desulfurispirillum indicum]ADU67015.1 PKD domain containing protein [Desulfurispirillum indicum S5]
MKRSLFPTFILLCLLLVLAACGSDGKDKTTPIPTAVATALQETVQMGSTVQLDGSTSSSPNGGSLSYQWAFVSKPELSLAEFSDSSASNPTFVADLPGTYEVQLRVVNQDIAISQPSQITITATNTQPVAVATTLLNRLVDSWVVLDGSRSVPPTGEDPAGLTYAWTLNPPDGSTDELNDPTSAAPGFSPTSEGIYIATLQVHFGDQSSKPLQVIINASRANAVPVADAGGPYEIELGETVTLDGSGSSDADGDTLSYHWTLLHNTSVSMSLADRKPRGSSAELDSRDGVTVTFTPDVVGTYNVQLEVFDGTALSAAQVATITVTKPDGHPNTPPVAVIYDHYPIGLGGSVGEAEITAWGYAYFYSGSYDNDGDALTHKWEWVEVPEDFKDTTHYTQEWLNTRSANVSFIAAPLVGDEYVPIEGYYTIRLSVNDGTVDSDPVEQTIHVRTGANTRPSAVANADIAAVLVGAEAWFDGSGSSDPQDGTTGLQYQWQWVYTPPGSNAVLNTPNAARTSFVPDLPGPYTAELIVTDNDGASSRPAHGNYTPSTATVNAKLTNYPPYARFNDVDISNGHENKESTFDNYGIDYDATTGIYTYQLGSIVDRCRWANPGTLQYHCADNFTVRVTAYDPDGDPLFYDITLQQPAGSSFQPSYTGAFTSGGFNTTPRASADIGRGRGQAGITVPGDYHFTLQASDGTDLSDPATLTVRVLDFPDDFQALQLGFLYDTNYRRGSADGSDLTNIHYPPFRISNPSFAEGSTYAEFADQGGVAQYYKLTAIGGSYSIQNAEAFVEKRIGFAYERDFAGSETFTPEFRDLPTVINAGETVVFSIWVPKLPAPAASQERYRMTWSFEIPEVATENHSGFYRDQIFTIPAQ